jgi:hypothetical protein
MHVLNPNTKKRKILITYYKTYGITTLEKHANANHVVIVKKNDKKVNGLIRRTFERQPTKKRPNAIYKFFVVKDPFKKDDDHQQIFFARPWPFNYEESIATAICEKCLVQTFGFTFVSLSCFPLLKQNFYEILPTLIDKQNTCICFTKICKLHICNIKF